MKNKLKRLAYACVSLAFWIALWQILAIVIDFSFILPRFDDTIKTFFALVITSEFWLITLSSLLRILLGFLLGVVLGIALAILSHSFEVINAIVSPAMTVVKSTPVASIILLLWCLLSKWIDKSNIPVVIALLMVMPIVWQNLMDGYTSISGKLDEVCSVFDVSPLKKFKILTFPTLIRYLIPALVTSSSLAWKSGIAAEIIVYAKNSIGKEITDAKNLFETERMFAWTIAVVLLSIGIEFLIKRLTRTVKRI